jgi:alkylation response protein AidB-like acyl-CoA dehydrogenase
MEFSLSTEHKLIQESVREFLKKDCPMEKVRELDENDECPLEIFDKMKQLGVSSLTIPEEYGGTGRDFLAATIVAEELSRRYPTLELLYAMSAFYGGGSIGENGSESQRQQLLPRIARGELLFSYAPIETISDTRMDSVQTTAARYNSGFKLYGKQTRTIGADRADYIMALARIAREGMKEEACTIFIVNKSKRGIQIYPTEKLGYKGLNYCEVAFSGVELEGDDVLGGASCIYDGWSQASRMSEIEHLQIAASGVGLAQGAFDEALKYAKNREQFGNPIGRFQAIQHMLAEMATGIQTARLLLYYVAWLVQASKPCALESAMVKYYAAEVAKRVSVQAMQIFGGYGYMMEYDIQRFVRDALALPARSGTAVVFKSIIGEKLGLV